MFERFEYMSYDGRDTVLVNVDQIVRIDEQTMTVYLSNHEVYGLTADGYCKLLKMIGIK